MHMWANDMTTGMQAHVLTHFRGLRTMHSHCANSQYRRTRVPRRAGLRVIRAVVFLHFRQRGSRAPADAGEEGLPGHGLSGKLNMLDISLQCQTIPLMRHQWLYMFHIVVQCQRSRLWPL